MKPWLLMSRAELRDQRPGGATEVVHFTESLAEAVIEEYSKPGELVLDPFAGFGTTARVAVRMGRRAVAVEILPERASYIREHLRDSAEVITGDARELRSLLSGPVDLCLTSPPYMTAADHPQNPLTGYTTADGESSARALARLQPFWSCLYCSALGRAWFVTGISRRG